VIPKLADITVEYIEKEPVPDNFQVRYHEKTGAGDTFEPVQLNELQKCVFRENSNLFC
jgi:hypothetical protein